jgi:hypothetical protein
MSTQQALALPSPPPSNTEFINARCSLRIEADQRVIVVAGLPVHHYRAEDTVAEAYAMVFLVQSGYAQQTDVARAFARAASVISAECACFANVEMPRRTAAERYISGARGQAQASPRSIVPSRRGSTR